jgi:hypothetical protein
MFIIDLRVMQWRVSDWICLAQNMYWLSALVNTVLDLRVPEYVQKFLSSRWAGGFYKRSELVYILPALNMPDIITKHHRISMFSNNLILTNIWQTMCRYEECSAWGPVQFHRRLEAPYCPLSVVSVFLAYLQFTSRKGSRHTNHTQFPQTGIWSFDTNNWLLWRLAFPTVPDGYLIGYLSIPSGEGSSYYCYRFSPLLTNPLTTSSTFQTGFRGCRANLR